MVRTFVSVLGTRAALSGLLILFPVVLALLFLFVERAFIFNLIIGDFPLWLFSRILPSLAYDFLFGNVVLAAHFAIIAFLLSVYLLLTLHIVRKRYFSIASIGTSTLGLVGISIGLTCISCGAFAGIFLVSMLGALSLPITLAHENTFFLMVGELLLLGSIGLVAYAIKRLERP